MGLRLVMLIAAGAGAIVLAGGQPELSAAPAPAAAPTPAKTLPVPSRPAAAGKTGSAGATQPSLSQLQSAAQFLRTQGQGEDAVYRLRAAALPARQVAELMEMEAAELHWQQRLAACAGDARCEASRFSVAEQRLLPAYRRPGVPTLRQEAP